MDGREDADLMAGRVEAALTEVGELPHQHHFPTGRMRERERDGERARERQLERKTERLCVEAGKGETDSETTLFKVDHLIGLL